MKIFWRLLIVLIIAVPIFVCWKALQTVWEEDDFVSSGEISRYPYSGDNLEEAKQKINDEEKKLTESNLGDGVDYEVSGTAISSKVYDNAEVAISLANVYKEYDETSEVLGKLEKGSKITVQTYDNGWSRITNYSLSGWMKTENIKLPSTENNMTLVTEDWVMTGVVKVDDALNVRESANKTAKVLKTLANGTVVNIIETTDDWYKIKIDGVTGWVAADYVTVK